MGQLREELQKDNRPANNQKEQFITDMEENLNTLSGQLTQTEQDYKEAQMEAKAIMKLVERLFETIECDREVVK